MKNLVKFCAFSLLLVPLIEEEARGQVFQVDQEWNFPAGTLEFGADGSITPIKFESSINAALDADQFTHETKEQGEVQGGVWKVGSNPGAAANIIDGDPETFWKPDPNDPVENWWIEINLGRAVPTSKIRLHFPDQEGAKPLGVFRVLGSNGVRQAQGQDFFFFDLIGGTSRLNEQTLIEYPVQAFGRVSNNRLFGPAALAGTDTSTTYGPIQFVRIVVDAQTADAALSEVEVFTFGQNIALNIFDRGGTITEPTGRASALVDGDLSTTWQVTSTDPTAKFSWSWDLGAHFWVNRILELAPLDAGQGQGAYAAASGHQRVQLFVSDGSRRTLAGEIEFDLLFDFPDAIGWNTPQWLNYLMFPPKSIRHMLHIYAGNRSSILNDIAVFPVGYVAKVEMTSGFEDLGDRPKVIRSLSWDADLPAGTKVQAQTRSGNTFEEQTIYYDKNGNEVTEELYNKLPKPRRGETQAVLVEGADWSGWSNPYRFSGQEFLSPSPRRYVQFAVSLISDRLDTAATLRSLSLDFDDAFLIGAVGEIEPKEARPGVAQKFVYHLRPQFGPGDSGFDRIRVETPSQADADSFSVQIDGSPVVLATEAVQFFPDSLLVELPQLVEQQPVDIEMYVNVVQSPYHFNAFVGNTQNPELWQPVDPDADVRFSTTVFLPDVVSSNRLITNLSVQPVFTPNGDGVGDEAKILFNILKVDMPAQVQIYTLDGSLVRQLEGQRQTNGLWLFTWSGQDHSQTLVPPGIYLCRINLEAQTSDEALAQTISVVY